MLSSTGGDLKLKKTKKQATQRLLNSSRSHHQRCFLYGASELLSNPRGDTCWWPEWILRDVFISTSQGTLGFREVSRKPWISDQTWQLIGERKVLKLKSLTSLDVDRAESNHHGSALSMSKMILSSPGALLPLVSRIAFIIFLPPSSLDSSTWYGQKRRYSMTSRKESSSICKKKVIVATKRHEHD